MIGMCISLYLFYLSLLSLLRKNTLGRILLQFAWVIWVVYLPASNPHDYILL